MSLSPGLSPTALLVDAKATRDKMELLSLKEEKKREKEREIER